jgi:hypothetical protein
VVYEGFGEGVDVPGKHRYRVDPAKVAQLLASARDKDLWSLQPKYRRPGVFDGSTFFISLTLGDQQRSIVDSAGSFAGMPEAVHVFENELDEVAQVGEWIHLGREAVLHLQGENFPFASREGSEVLRRAIADENAADDQAILQLIKLGAPWDTDLRQEHYGCPIGSCSALGDALYNQREGVVEELLAQGALRTGSAIDPAKLDAAFRAAIRGGQLSLVKKIWDAAGDAGHPSLTYDDPSEETPWVTPDQSLEQSASGADRAREKIQKRSSVTLLLRRSASTENFWKYRGKPWEGLAIARWLIEKGCDIRAQGADGRTLLHIAARAGDAGLVRFVLSQGVPALTLGHYLPPAIAGVQEEDVALILLEAGIETLPTELRRSAVSKHWDRVVVWLDQHPK